MASSVAAAVIAMRRGRAWAGSAPGFRVAVQPLGEVGVLERQGIVDMIARLFGIEVKVLAAVALPAIAFHAPRRRYRAERILEWLSHRLPVDGAQVLAVTTVDISTTKGEHKDWGVLGLGEIGGRTAVISSFRCGRRARSAAHARQRLAKVAVHELGHTFGLEHCATRGCLMEDAGGKVATLDRETGFCERCRAFLLRLGLPLPPAAATGTDSRSGRPRSPDRGSGPR